MPKLARRALLSFAVALLVALASGGASADEVAAEVERMSRIGRCWSPSFSPDGERLAVVCDLSGIPQVWIVPATGGFPRMVTAFEDRVGGVLWSPGGDRLALSLAPGGGMNQQVYVVRPDGTDLSRITDGREENNWLQGWSPDGSAVILSSNRDDGRLAALAWNVAGRSELEILDLGTGEVTARPELPAELAGPVDFSPDGRRLALVASGSTRPTDVWVYDLADGSLTLAWYPELFAAGVDLFGMVNFATFFEQTEPWMAAISTVEYGDPETQADLLWRLSPLSRIERITAPTLVLHGANDTNVPLVEAEQVAETLEERGVPVKLVVFPDEGHGFRKTPNRIRSIAETVAWFEEHLAKEE